MSPRRFDNLRARAPQTVASQEEPIEAVIRRHLLVNVDGQRIVRWMLDKVQEPTPLNCSEAALRDAEGARRFVNNLLQQGGAG